MKILLVTGKLTYSSKAVYSLELVRGLVKKGHEVHVAYQVSGNIAVFDDEALRYAGFVHELCASLGFDAEDTALVVNTLE